MAISKLLKQVKELSVKSQKKLPFIDTKKLRSKALPYFTLEIIKKYLRVQSYGIENIPKKGAAIIICNHSGFSGFDALMLYNEIQKNSKRTLHMVAHKLWFVGKPIRSFSESFAFIKADKESIAKALKEGKLVLIFPEGEEGNFKASHKRYKLQEFKRGFVRLALECDVPIITSYVIGAEETHINLSKISWAKYIIGSSLPLPANILPLPIKWKIRFLPPRRLDQYDSQDRFKQDLVRKIAKQYQREHQRAIIRELRLSRHLILP